MTGVTTESCDDLIENRLARLATEVLAPWVWVLCLPLAVAWRATGHVGQTLLWGLVVGVTGSVIPMTIVVRGARAGRRDGHPVVNRAGRLVPFFACITSLAGSIAILLVGGCSVADDRARCQYVRDFGHRARDHVWCALEGVDAYCRQWWCCRHSYGRVQPLARVAHAGGGGDRLVACLAR